MIRWKGIDTGEYRVVGGGGLGRACLEGMERMEW